MLLYIINEKDIVNIRILMKVVMKCFWDFLIESEMLVNCKDMLFYCGVRKIFGDFFKKSVV